MMSKTITLKLSDEAYQNLESLASVTNFLVKEQKLEAEDIVYAALGFYLRRFYPHLKNAPIEDKLYNLSLNYPLKNRIKDLLDGLNISQSRVATELNLPKTTLSNIVNNNNQPTMDIFLRLYPILGYPPLHEVFYREIPD